jgi:hypothetical protein
MRRLSVLALGLLCVALAAPAFAVQRTVLCEDFTNFNCPPCDAIEDSMNTLFAQWIAAGKVAPFRYHVWWPDPADPWYNYNPSDPTAKVNYYSISYVPSFRYDGQRRIDPSDYGTYAAYYADLAAKVDSLYAIPSSIELTVTHEVVGPDVNVHIEVAVPEDNGDLGTAQALYAVVMEQNQNSVSGKEWYIFRDFVQVSASGEPLALALNDVVSFDWTFPRSHFVQLSKGRIVVWVQKTSGNTRKVLQSGYYEIQNPTDVTPGLPVAQFRLEQNQPNPFNPRTSIRYALDKAGAVKLSVFDPSGRLVTELANGRATEGEHQAYWNGEDRQGNPVASGVYYYRLETDTKSQTRKMTLIR